MAADQTQQPATCPVDHKSREAWLEKAKVAAAEASPTSPTSNSNSATTPLPPSHPPISTSTSTSGNADGCPVDHGAREVWIQQARAASDAASPPISTSPSTTTTTTPSSWSSYLPRIPFFSSPTTPPKPSTTQPASHLGIDREVSTIPRTTTLPSDASSPRATTPAVSSEHPPSPANNEQETGADLATGNWIYPSERMFFDAMKRKGHDPRAADMRTVVPIHNAVNERAWAEIKAWEAPWVQRSSCDGPRLHSFSGLSTKMSPRARLNTLLGYQAPFDRHDWVVDRCGREVEYVIDFYAGRPTPAGGDGKLSFYLDVRPKLNSWEGVKMRAFRAVGLA
ncbi:cytochrome c/c1 heme-lyase [Nemania sp. NC0429]|nr:cytochrome c/c1 heme-lyase [Nemania sp. NC0429]